MAKWYDKINRTGDGKGDGVTLYSTDGSGDIYFGVYACHVCDKEYTVNQAWGPCTPDTCHHCYERLTREPANDPK